MLHINHKGKKKHSSSHKKDKGLASWCKRQGFGGVTSACIARGKASGNPLIVKRASLSK